MVTTTALDSPLLRMTQETPTQYWNDSCAVDELTYAIERGATGATSNPSIVLDVMKKEKAHWVPRVHELAAANPTWSEVELTWAIIEEMAARGAGILYPVFDRTGGRHGRLSVQTNPANHRDPARMTEQAVRFAALAPNIQVKFPVTASGLVAIEEATFRGVNINGTVSFTVPQAIAIAEAVERGLDRRAAAGHDIASMTPIATIMIGRLDDWMKIVVERDNLAVHPDAPNWAGVAAFKRAYGIFRERGYRSRLLAAAYRHRLHWTELVGGERQPDAPVPLAGPLQRERDRAPAADGRAGRSRPHRRPLRPDSRLPPRLRAGRDDPGRVRDLRGERANLARLRQVLPRPHGRDPGPGPARPRHPDRLEQLASSPPRRPRRPAGGGVQRRSVPSRSRCSTGNPTGALR
jgi:transaldolase